jgi:hypothetical protein
MNISVLGRLGEDRLFRIAFVNLTYSTELTLAAHRAFREITVDGGSQAAADKKKSSERPMRRRMFTILENCTEENCVKFILLLSLNGSVVSARVVGR